jgi:hypothetical protein
VNAGKGCVCVIAGVVARPAARPLPRTHLRPLFSQGLAESFVLRSVSTPGVHCRQCAFSHVLHRARYHDRFCSTHCLLTARVVTIVRPAVTEPLVCLVSLWGSTGLPITQRPAQARQSLLSGVDEVWFACCNYLHAVYRRRRHHSAITRHLSPRTHHSRPSAGDPQPQPELTHGFPAVKACENRCYNRTVLRKKAAGLMRPVRYHSTAK